MDEESEFREQQYRATSTSNEKDGMKDWSRRWRQRYDGDDDGEDDTDSRPRIGIVQLGLFVIVLCSIFLAILNSFSPKMGYLHCDYSPVEPRFFTSSSHQAPDEKIEGRRGNVLRARDLAIRQDPTTAPASTASSSAATATATPLRVFQVDTPVLGAGGLIFNGDNITTSTTGAGGVSGESCSVTLMEFVFGDSFGKPFVGDYTPPACVGSSNTVMMNFSVTSKGRQFDRLAIMYVVPQVWAGIGEGEW